MPEQSASIPSREGPVWDAYKEHFDACDECEDTWTNGLCDEGDRLRRAWWAQQ